MPVRRPPLRSQARRRILGAVLAMGAALPVHLEVRADAGGRELERSVKAAFLYKFLMYTEFPASAFPDPAAPLVIGVAGADDLARDLSRLVAGRTINRHPLLVRPVRDHDPLDGMHLLFVGGDDPGRLARLPKAGQGAPMLVVTEAENGLQHGSVINFRIVAERVRFDVSLDAADKNKIKLSSRLLTVANHVQKGAP
jgi:hypothetical protein